MHKQKTEAHGIKGSENIMKQTKELKAAYKAYKLELGGAEDPLQFEDWYDKEYQAPQLKEVKPEFHNASLKEEFEKDLHKYCSLSFSIEIDNETETVDLIIQSTSLAQIDGADENMYHSFSYMDENEAREDLKAMEETGMIMEEI